MDRQDDEQTKHEELALSMEDIQQIESQRNRQQEAQRKRLQQQSMTPLHRVSKNMEQVGATAYWLATAIESAQRDEEEINRRLSDLEKMAQDDMLDPKSRQLAQQFSKYMRAYDDFRLFGETQYNFDSGEVMYRNENGKVVVEQDGQVIMKPEASEDPRGVGVTSGAILKKYLRDNSQDRAVALALMNTPTTSQMLKGIHSDISGLVQQNDGARFEGIEREIIRQEQLSGVRPKPPEVQKKKKLFSFGKQNNDIT